MPDNNKQRPMPDQQRPGQQEKNPQRTPNSDRDAQRSKDDGKYQR